MAKSFGQQTFSNSGLRLLRGNLAPAPSANGRSLFFDGLNLGNRVFDRLKSRLGEVGIEFAHFFRLLNEAFIRRLRKIRLDSNHSFERLSAEQFFDENKTVIY